MLDRTIYWIIWSPKYISMTGKMNSLLDENIPVGVQIVHSENMKIVWSS